MLRTGDSETEILLGNKQLLGIFFVVAVLLGVAFYGGYMVGKTVPSRKPVAATSRQDTASSQSAPPAGSGGETHTLSGDTSTAPDLNPTDATEPDTGASAEPPLGTRKPGKAERETAGSFSTSAEPAASRSQGAFIPESGQQFLQVAAVGKDEALGVANVLHSKGFSAHAVPKPGNPKLYRVLIGPLRDAGDLSTTREALRRTGFREVIVQKY
jgi:cell division septation protein DedD